MPLPPQSLYYIDLSIFHSSIQFSIPRLCIEIYLNSKASPQFDRSISQKTPLSLTVLKCHSRAMLPLINQIVFCCYLIYIHIDLTYESTHPHMITFLMPSIDRKYTPFRLAVSKLLFERDPGPSFLASLYVSLL